MANEEAGLRGRLGGAARASRAGWARRGRGSGGRGEVAGLWGAAGVRLGCMQQFDPGVKVKVIQQVPRQNGGLSSETVGTVVRYEQSKTGSWYAHSKDDRLWLDRLILLKEDGEKIVMNLDQYSVVEPA